MAAAQAVGIARGTAPKGLGPGVYVKRRARDFGEETRQSRDQEIDNFVSIHKKSS